LKPQRYAKENRTLRTAHLTARSDKSVAYVTTKDSTRRFILLKLTTDRHEASHGLFATAELLVEIKQDICLLLFFLIWGDTRCLRMPALRPASQAGPMRNPKEGTSVVLRDTTRLT